MMRLKQLQTSFRRSLKRHQTGQAILLLAFGFIVLLGFVGLVTDVSLLYVRYTSLRRAVDSAAVAAAGQVRTDRDPVTYKLAAQQFLEFHGIETSTVWVETCQDLPESWKVINTSDPGITDEQIEQKRLADEVCDDQRKLVRVTAQIQSPMVFMRLFGYESVTLQATAISETASLDVVVVLDVSESMLTETTYDTYNEELFGGSSDNRQIARVLPVRLLDNLWEDYKLQGGTLEPPDFIREFLATYTFGAMQIRESRGIKSNSSVPGVPAFIMLDVNPAKFYMDGNTPRVFDEGAIDIPGDPVAKPINVKDLRTECQVRIHPTAGAGLRSVTDRNSGNISDLSTLLGQYIEITERTDGDSAWETGGVLGSPGRYDMFQTNYDFYGCCNDPTNGGSVDLDGNITVPAGDAPFASSDWDFSDLVCQPFKDARDATRLFLQNIDFFRGDRVAFVTFDQSAYIIDPDGVDLYPGGGPLTPMIDNLQAAVQTLDQIVGVRAEPTYYFTDHNSGNAIDKWDSYSSGVTLPPEGQLDLNGDGIMEPGEGYPIGIPRKDYTNTQVGAITDRYLLYDSCPFYNVAMPYFFTLWTWKTDPYGPLGEIAHPDPENGNWKSHFDGIGVDNSWVARQNYEMWASCRGTNIGGALRQANNVLLTPSTTRQKGTVWVIVLLSDGAAGASDPIPQARNGATMILSDAANPYNRDASAPALSPDEDPLMQPLAGDYGAYGFCPYGGDASANNATGGHVTKYPPQFPFCSDTSPTTRHSCGTDIDNDPNKKQDDRELTNIAVQSFNNQFDNDECATSYDVDDYARDWADYVARERNSQSGTNLPSIFTIGFNLEFPNSPGDCASNVQDCLGEELLRYIADVGDNNRWDDNYGVDDGVARKEDFGNYYNAPDKDDLQNVFNDIAGKLFTRLAG